MATSDPSDQVSGPQRRISGASRPGVVIEEDNDGVDVGRGIRRHLVSPPPAAPEPTQAANPDIGRSKKPSSGPPPEPTTSRRRLPA